MFLLKGGNDERNWFVVAVSDTTNDSHTLKGRLCPSVTEFMLALTTTGRRGAKDGRMGDSAFGKQIISLF